MSLPATGRSFDEIREALASARAGDVRWREGRAFSLTYFAGHEVHEFAEEVFASFMTENALNTEAFGSLRMVQAEVVDIVSGWLQGGPEAAGFMTSGGTESLLLAVKAARQRGRLERGIDRPNMVLPASAHAAFEKAAYYFDVESRRVPVRADWRADPVAMAEAIDDNTVLVVASAPQYPQGVIDPVSEIAALAAARGVNCHVDACMGGVVLAYLERLEGGVPPWNFAVEGVTSMSVDLHKFGYTGKGASVLLHRNKALRRHQTFVTDNWLGGVYGSSGILGSKSGAPLAAAWAVMQAIGDDGYLELTATARAACLELAAGIRAIPELVLRAEPDTTLMAVGAAQDSELDVFAVAEELWRNGWYVDRQGPPNSLHLTVNAVHHGLIPTFLEALRSAIAAVLVSRRAGEGGAYGTVE
jgi:glutamate/tyrosine decarboxylase-like PLP-dependent enzyme